MRSSLNPSEDMMRTNIESTPKGGVLESNQGNVNLNESDSLLKENPMVTNSTQSHLAGNLTSQRSSRHRAGLIHR